MVSTVFSQKSKGSPSCSLTHNATKSPYEVVYLTGGGTANRVGNANTVNTGLVNRLVEIQKINEVTSEGILGTEPDLEALGLDELDDFKSRLDDVLHVLAVGVLAEEAGSSNNQVAVANIRGRRDWTWVWSTHSPSTPVSTASLASSMWHRTSVRTVSSG